MQTAADLIFTAPRNQLLFRFAAAATVLQFVAFKVCYPQAGFINGDSYVYIQSAIYNFEINTYPVGYSKFLRIFSTFSRSDTALVAFQYLAIQSGILALLFTLFDYYSPTNLIRWLTFTLTVLNPVFLYLSNYVSSDALFLALSLFWFTTLILLLNRPSTKLLICHILILLFTFTVRYNALYYPVVSALGFLLTHESPKKKLKAIFSTTAPIILFVFYISNLNYQAVGIRQFTAFSGWQLANNAMYAYRYVNENELKAPPPELQNLDKLVRHYFDTSRDLDRHPQEMLQASTVYMWDPNSPLQKFMNIYTSKDSAGFFQRWARMGPIYGRYGAWLIHQYPDSYCTNYLLQNAIKFYAPPGEFLFQYNMGLDTVTTVAQNWFRYPTRKVSPAFGDYRVTILDYMPILAAVMNIVFLISGLGLLFLRRFRLRTTREKVLILVISFWLLNFVFSVTAAPVTLRYQLFPILIATFFALLLADKLVKLAFLNSRDSAPDSDPDRSPSSAPDKAADSYSISHP